MLLDDLLVDAAAAHLVREPERFDVLLVTNFYGDILTDLASELSSSLGLAGSIVAGDALCCAQAQHRSAPSLAGKVHGETPPWADRSPTKQSLSDCACQ